MAQDFLECCISCRGSRRLDLGHIRLRIRFGGTCRIDKSELGFHSASPPYIRNHCCPLKVVDVVKS